MNIKNDNTIKTKFLDFFKKPPKDDMVIIRVDGYVVWKGTRAEYERKFKRYKEKV